MFDLVVMGWVAKHLENPQKVFNEIHRVLKPGGKVIFLIIIKGGKTYA